MKLKNTENNIYLSLGTNIGNRITNIELAINLIKDKSIAILNKSNIYESNPMYYTKQNKFLNITVQIKTIYNPEDLLLVIKNIEKIMGRKKSLRNYPRIIDIDILCYNEIIINNDNLIIPHPKISERLFVLKTMNDLCPNLILPNTNKSINELMLLLYYNDDIIKLYKQII